MPNSHSAQGDTNVSRVAKKVEIRIRGGAALDTINPIQVVQRTGMEPDTFTFEVGVLDEANRSDHVSDVLLASNSVLSEKRLPYWSRVEVLENGEPLFNGWLVRRVDESRAGKIQFTCVDDKGILARWPICGALVWDPYTETIKYVERYFPVVNAGGYKNCKLATIEGQEGQVPVFTWIAEYDTKGVGDFEETSQSEAAQSGQEAPTVVFWTPERWLQYLKLFMTFQYSEFHSYMLRLDDNSTLKWSAIAFGGGESSGMRQKMPTIDFTGQSILSAIVKTCDMTGEVGFHLQHDIDFSHISFHPVNDRAASQDDGADSPADVHLQRDGEVEDIKSIYAFSVETDAEDLVASVVQEGATPWIESSWEFDGNTPDTSDGALLPAWTQDEDDEFRAIVKGDGTNASVLQKYGDFGGTRVVMDGTNGNPTIQSNTTSALRLARQMLSKPFRAFKLASDTSVPGYVDIATALAGADQRYQDMVDAEVLLSAPRPIGPEQLQPAFEIGGEARGKLRYPVRIEVFQDDTGYVDVTQNNGLRVTGDGLIWLDGITDEAQSEDRIYNGSFLTNPDNVTMKKVRINAYIPHDVRVRSIVNLFQASADEGTVNGSTITSQLDWNKIRSIIRPSAALNGLRSYALDPDDYHEEHQVNSSPAKHDKWPKPDGTPDAFDDDPLTRILTDRVGGLVGSAMRAAKRSMAVSRRGRWEFPGIRSDLYAGRFVRDVIFHGTRSGRWQVRRPIAMVIIDFQGQRTEIHCE